jgi:arylsulfatase A-like enzyme
MRLHITISSLLLPGALLAGEINSRQSVEKPNVLIIIADDLNDWIGPYGGHSQTKTPNIDRLVSNNALVMQNAQCAATICGPSRASLLTGLRPSTTGLYNNTHYHRDSEIAASVPTMPEYFSQNGYFSLSTGKIFHKHTTPQGLDEGGWAFDLWERETGGFQIDNSKVPLSGMPSSASGTTMDWGPTIVGKETTTDWISAQWAANKFQQDFDKPFFMMLGIARPHLSWYVPQEYFDRFGLDTTQAANFKLDDLNDILTPSGKKKFSATSDFNTISQYNKFKEAARAYLASISYVDDCVGLILDGLENSQYKDNTIILFMGDHGWFLGEKLRFRKNNLWEESCRTPLIIKGPGITASGNCYRPVSFMDIYPTLAELCGLPRPVHCEGRSIVPLLTNPTLEWYPALTTMNYNNHSIRSDRYRYNRYNDGTEELYDHSVDPMEWNNLSKNPAYASVMDAHKVWLPDYNSRPTDVINSISLSSPDLIYPNPVVSGMIFKKAPSEFTVYTIDGKRLMHESNTRELDISILKPGVYIVKDEKGYSQKIIKK